MDYTYFNTNHHSLRIWRYRMEIEEHAKDLPFGVQVLDAAIRAAFFVSRLEPVMVEFSPGNMTRYEVMLCPLGAVEDPESIRTKNQWNHHFALVSLTNSTSTKSAVLPVIDRSLEDRVHPSYVAEKMEITEGDAEPLSSFLILLGAMTVV